MSSTPYSDNDGWASTNDFRIRENPNRAWYNAIWTPKQIIQVRLVKMTKTGLIAKWQSVDLTYRIEDSDEACGGED